MCSWVHHETPRRRSLLSNKTFLHAWYMPKSIWTLHNITERMLCGRMRLKWSCVGRKHSICNIIIKTSSHCWSTVKRALEFGAALLPQSLKNLQFKSLPRHLTRKSQGVSPPAELTRGRVLQQDNDTKRWSKSTSEWLLKKKILLEWLSGSPDLNPIEMLWRDLKRASHSRHPKNLVGLTVLQGGMAQQIF